MHHSNFRVLQLVPVGLLICFFNHQAAAAGRRRSSQECYDSANPNMIRLWEGAAPGAVGKDPCRDIPFMHMYRAKSKDKKGGKSAILIIPGGGYDRLTNKKEQAPVAKFFADKLDVTAFVLFYRLVQSDGTYHFPVPMQDGQRALKLIRSKAAKFEIDPDKVGVFGFSAGGHLASTITLHAKDHFELKSRDAVDKINGLPNFLGLGYPVISMDPKQFASPNSRKHLLHGYKGTELSRLERFLSAQKHVTAGTPPVFLFESMDDKVTSPQNSVLFQKALQTAKVPADVHLFAHGVHGSGLSVGIKEEEAWPELFHKWLMSHYFI